MVEIDITYQGELKCLVRHGPSGAELVTDAPKDNEGEGTSFSPTDLAASALGACMVTIMGIVARRKDLDIAGTRVNVTKEMSKESPRRIVRLATTISVPTPLSAEQQQMLECAALSCPVHHSLHPEVDAPVNFEWA